MADHSTEDLVGVFAPIPNGRVLAALCQFNGLKGRVLENAAGTLAILDDASPEASQKVGRAVSIYARGMQVAVLDRRGGQLTVDVWSGGEHQRSLPAGLVLADAPGVVLSLASGAQTMDDIAATHPDKVFAARGSRWGGFWALQRLARQAKRELKAARDA